MLIANSITLLFVSAQLTVDVQFQCFNFLTYCIQIIWKI